MIKQRVTVKRLTMCAYEYVDAHDLCLFSIMCIDSQVHGVKLYTNTPIHRRTSAHYTRLQSLDIIAKPRSGQQMPL